MSEELRDAAPGRERRRIYVHLPHGLDADAYRERYEAGQEPDESPYGFHVARERGLSVTFSRDEGRWLRRAGVRLQRRLDQIDLFHALFNRRRMMDADVIWTMLENEALAIALLIRLRLLPRKPIIVGSVWMINEWETLSPRRQRMIRHLSRYWTVLTVHSERCLDRARSILPDVTSRLLHFGIAAATFAPREPVGVVEKGALRIVAAGNDRTRDWGVLLRAFGNDPRFHLTIVCWWLTDEAVAPYRNVDVPRNPTTEDFRSLYAAADYVAVPMHDNLFSGITVALEAAAMGKPILATRTGGVPTYFGEDEMLFAKVDDATGMRDAVLGQTPAEREAMARRAHARFLDRDYSTRGMIARYIALTDELAPPPEATGTSQPRQ